MSQPANTFSSDRTLTLDLDFDLVNGDLLCRDDQCVQLGVHTIDSGCCLRSKGPTRRQRGYYHSKSRVNAATPWRIYCYDALNESVYNATSLVEPRHLQAVARYVLDDYGTCCERTIQRHLAALRESGRVVRMDFCKRVHAYLRAGSRLLNDPDLVFEQIMNLHAGEAA